jgi:hypothetical protein
LDRADMDHAAERSSSTTELGNGTFPGELMNHWRLHCSILKGSAASILRNALFLGAGAGYGDPAHLLQKQNPRGTPCERAGGQQNCR